jgi:RNA polymerase sigma-70 factor (ECF subfamily)
MDQADPSITILQLRRAKEGDREALNDLLERYLPRVRSAVAVLVGQLPSQIADLDDILQEVLISAADSLGRFESRSDGTFMSWLATIALNKVRDRKRHALRIKRGAGRVQAIDDVFATSAADVPLPARDPRPSQMLRAREIEEAELQALLQLDDRYREVIVYRDLLGMSHEEIAAKLGFKTPSPARALYSRAKAKLRPLLRAFDPDQDDSQHE